MPIKLPSHLCRSRSGILHFRITIPPDLRSHFDSKEIHRSLGTASVRDAQYSEEFQQGEFQNPDLSPKSDLSPESVPV